jgi:hypothetical protein
LGPPSDPAGKPQHGANFSLKFAPVIPSKLHPCHLERGGPPPMHYGGVGLLVDLGGRMHPLSNHDMAKLVRATGWRVELPLTREDPAHPDRSRWPGRWQRIALHVAARPAIRPPCPPLAAAGYRTKVRRRSSGVSQRPLGSLAEWPLRRTAGVLRFRSPLERLTNADACGRVLFLGRGRIFLDGRRNKAAH